MGELSSSCKLVLWIGQGGPRVTLALCPVCRTQLVSPSYCGKSHWAPGSGTWAGHRLWTGAFPSTWGSMGLKAFGSFLGHLFLSAPGWVPLWSWSWGDFSTCWGRQHPRSHPWD